MAQEVSDGKRREQEKQYAGAVVHANPAHQLVFVDSDNGNDGNNGFSPRHPLATLTQALTKVQAGDTIVLAPGGSETVTATLAVSLRDLNIVCPVKNPNQGFTIAGAVGLDLMTVSASDVRVEGLRFAHAAGAGTAVACLLGTLAADRLLVKNCMFDEINITSSWISFGIEIGDELDNVHIIDCEFRDCHRGVEWTHGAGLQKGALISGCRFWVGQPTAYGVHANVAGNIRGLIIEDCTFFELDGDGSGATDAWDGTTPTDGASGPIKFGATTDQFIIQNCRCSGTVDFENRVTIDGGAAGTLVGNISGGSSAADILTVVTATNNELSTHDDSLSTHDDALSTHDDALSTHNGASLSALNDVSTVVTSTKSIVTATNNELSTHADSLSTHDDALSTHDDALSTHNGASLSAINDVSVVVTSTKSIVVATNNELSTAQDDLTLLRTGSKFWISKNIESSAISTSQIDLTGVSSGSDLFINNIILQTDSTGLTTGTNFQITANNDRGLLMFFSESIANLGGNKTVDMSSASVANQPVLLESGKKLQYNNTGAGGTGAGDVTVYVEFERLGPTGTIAAA